MFSLERLAIPGLLFSRQDPSHTATDKLRGLHRFGPYQQLRKPPTFAFVFPSGRNEDANSLFRALRSGVGPFKGFPTVFRTRFERNQVEAVTGFTIPEPTDGRAVGHAYSEAIAKWLRTHTQPDLMFILHDKTPEWEEDTPYHYCKRLLLQLGVVSQSVTFDLLRNPTQFEWSAANIALAVFCKLGGVPWITARAARQEHIIIGVGRAEVQDPVDRWRRRRTAFTTCLTGSGEFRFSTVARTMDSDGEYLTELTRSVSEALRKATGFSSPPSAIAIHVTKDFSRGEMEAVQAGLTPGSAIDVTVLKVTDEPHFFLVDSDASSGLPQRGTCIRLSERDALLYTEGSDDPKTWRDRLPAAVRIRDYSASKRLSPDAIAEVLDLSQVNFRGFNARSAPAPLVYSRRVARLIEANAQDASGGSVHASLSEKMWFL
jgi:argonaute-like protein implicated in RNA metabolism and viral defense